MKRTTFGALLCAALALLPAYPAAGLDLSVPAINGDDSRTLLGDGTGVVVGVIDSGVDDTHPALTGMDSMGQPRMLAEANFVPSEPFNTGDDVHGHGTWVASVIASSDATNTGLAPDARFVNARVLDNSNGFANDIQVRNGVGFAIDQGADILNLSLNYFSTFSSGNGQLDLMLDWAASDRGVSSAICVGNINDSGPTVRGPGGAYNGMTVGRTDSDFDQVHPNSANAFTQNDRMKPDIVAPGTSITMANDDWERQVDFTSSSGCSFATPHVAGMMAQQIEAGRDNGLSTNPLVIKATTMNSASKDVLDKNGNPWESASDAQPLDTHSGAGQVDGLALAEQYLAGEQDAGLVDAIGWDLASVGDSNFVDYIFNSPLEVGSELTATLTWFRNVSRTDLGATGVDASDRFTAEPLDNLDLILLGDNQVVAQSTSTRDNVEHLLFAVDPRVEYTLRVLGTDVFGPGADELFAVAWSAVAVPEPSAWALLLIALISTRRGRASAS